jgi:hypothetical protein
VKLPWATACCTIFRRPLSSTFSTPRRRRSSSPKPGAAHGWPNWFDDTELFVDWFDEHLAKKEQ